MASIEEYNNLYNTINDRDFKENLIASLRKVGSGGIDTANLLKESKLLLDELRESRKNCICGKTINDDDNNDDENKKTVEKCDEARKSTFEYLQVDYVSECFKEAYTVSSLMLAEARLLQSTNISENAKEALRAIDLTLLRGGISLSKMAKPLIIVGTSIVMNENQKSSNDDGGAKKRRKIIKKTFEDYQKSTFHYKRGVESELIKEIPRISANDIDIDTFKSNYLMKNQPVIITNAMDKWPAMDPSGDRCWENMDYLKDLAGERLVPVEVYSNLDKTQTYLSDSWEQRVMKLREYIDEYVLNEDDSNDEANDRERGYLAQYQLFDQIPNMRNDIITPIFCKSCLLDSDKIPESELYDKDDYIDEDGVRASAWFGPSGTVSPLHHDPFHNILAQSVGFKYLRLYDFQHTQRLYPYPVNHPLCNNSNVNIDDIDEAKYPLFSSTEGWQCILAPGDMLYIPRHYWHYVRSLSLSFSVSFFWGKRMALER